MRYFGLRIEHEMFPENCTITKRVVTADFVRNHVDDMKYSASFGLVALESLVHALQLRFGIVIPIPEPPYIYVPRLKSGDSIIIVSVNGHFRLPIGCSEEKIRSAEFSFVEYYVQ